MHNIFIIYSLRKGSEYILEFEHNILQFNDKMPACFLFLLYLLLYVMFIRIFIYSRCIIYKAQRLTIYIILKKGDENKGPCLLCYVSVLFASSNTTCSLIYAPVFFLTHHTYLSASSIHSFVHSFSLFLSFSPSLTIFTIDYAMSWQIYVVLAIVLYP